MPQINTPDIKSQAIVGSKLSNTIAIPSGATCTTAGTGDNDNSLASTAFVQQELISNTTYFSDTFTGTGTALDPIDIDSSLFAVTAGTYSPTLSNTTNITSSTPQVTHYFKIGNQVFVSGLLTFTLTNNAIGALGISLPISSNFTSSTDCTGSVTITGAGGLPINAIIVANTTTDVAEINTASGILDDIPLTAYFTFIYTVI